jgi:hypothetical protein
MVTNPNHGKDRNHADILKTEIVITTVTGVKLMTALTAVMTVTDIITVTTVKKVSIYLYIYLSFLLLPLGPQGIPETLRFT